MKFIQSAMSKCRGLVVLACSGHTAANIVDDSKQLIKVMRTLVSPKPSKPVVVFSLSYL